MRANDKHDIAIGMLMQLFGPDTAVLLTTVEAADPEDPDSTLAELHTVSNLEGFGPVLEVMEKAVEAIRKDHGNG